VTVLADSSALVRRLPIQLAVLGLGYWLAVVGAVELVSPANNIALFWPPNAVAVAALIVAPRRHWPLMLGVAALAYFAGRMPSGHFPLFVYFGLCSANLVEILIVAGIVRRVIGGPLTQDNLISTLMTAMWAVIPATVGSALIGSAFVVAALPDVTYAGTALGWFSGDLAGQVLVLPVMLVWIERGFSRPRRLDPVQMLENTGIIVSFFAVSGLVLVYLSDVSHINLIFPYLAFPLLVWTAIRSGLRGTASAVFAVGIFIIGLTYFGFGPFHFDGLSNYAEVVLMKIGLIAIGLTTIFLNVVVVGRREVEVALSESQVDYRNAMQGSLQGMLIVTVDRKPLYVNDECARIFGYDSAAEMMTLDSTLALIAPHEIERLTELRQPFAGGDVGAKVAYEFEGVRKDGSRIWLELRGGAVQWRGQLAGQLAMVDITERRQAEEDRRIALIDAEQANQAKSDFLATMSHELRTPLNAILGFSDMIEGQVFGALGSQKYKEYAHDIHSSGEHLLALVNDILDLAAIESGKQPLVVAEMSVADAIQGCSPIINVVADEKSLDFLIDVPDDLPPLHADRRAIKQILFNLLTNAVKYTPAGGELRVAASMRDGAHVFEIRDSGIGIPPERMPNLTEPFVRTETDPHLPQEGSGLGLAIVKSLVDLHHGELDIKSEVGVGTTVTVTLPNPVAAI